MGKKDCVTSYFFGQRRLQPCFSDLYRLLIAKTARGQSLDRDGCCIIFLPLIFLPVIEHDVEVMLDLALETHTDLIDIAKFDKGPPPQPPMDRCAAS